MNVLSAARAGAGFTLVELVMSIVLLGLALASVSVTMAHSAGRSSDGLWQVKVVELSDAYFAEILARRFDENSAPGGIPACSISTTPCSAAVAFSDGETRTQFDDVDDYDGLDESPPRDASGNVRSDYTGYRVQISVAYADAGMIAAYALDDATDAKVITARVSAPGQNPLTFTAYRGNY